MTQQCHNETERVLETSSVIEASEVSAFDDHRMERVQKLLNNLDSTQDSIVGASAFILQLCGKAPSFAPCIVKLIMKDRL